MDTKGNQRLDSVAGVLYQIGDCFLVIDERAGFEGVLIVAVKTDRIIG